MLNLLFISDSPKAEYIKRTLQPVLKVVIDVVTDFDNGLKDVFEKRPGTVCIQDKIGGVTGESVARHIQMLLGNSAPTFILLHSGNGPAKAAKGLYEHLIDMSQPDGKLVEDLEDTLKLLLGEKWEKIYIPPKAVQSSVRLPVSVPVESRADADKLVDDFLSDLEKSDFPVIDGQTPFAPPPDNAAGELSRVPQPESHVTPENVSRSVEFDRAQSINDSLAEILLLEGANNLRDEGIAAAPSPDTDKPEADLKDISKPKTVSVKPRAHVFAESSVSEENTVRRNQSAKVSAPLSENKGTQTALPPVTPPPVAEFQICKNAPQHEDPLPEDLLLAFEENYRSESLFVRRRAVIALICVIFAGGGWYLGIQKSQLVSSLKQRFMSSLSGAQQPEVTPPAATPVMKTVPPPVLRQDIPLTLPAFIPKEGQDSSYALKHPGWQRYVGKLHEFRVFSASGHIQAVQVLSVKDAPVSETLLKSVLIDLVGSADYRTTSRSSKAGVRIENGKIQNKGDVKIYRQNGAIKAFVVSVN